MNRPCFACLVAVASAGAIACGSSSNGTSPPDGSAADVHSNDAGTHGDGAKHDAGQHDGGQHDAAPKADAAAATTTIAKARSGNVMSTITVNGFVTALAGVPKDYPIWYIEDPEGGPNSGVAVYCDPLATNPCHVAEPALNDLIQVTGKLSTYNGEVQLEPTSMGLIQSNAKAPPVATLTAADIAPTANSPYRGVFVKLGIASKLTVDDVTPAALADTACGAMLPTDAGAAEGGAKDGGPVDAGPPHCSTLCRPPVYAGFRANDGMGNEVYVEAPFFNTDPLQSSPECLTQKGVVPVRVGMTFSALSGILDVDPYSGDQALSPVTTADYTTP